MVSVRAFPFCPLVFVLTLFGGLRSAEPQSTGGLQAPAGKKVEETAPGEAPAFNVKVNLVLVPVVVRDREGLAVGNLAKEDFELFDKGKPQVITRFAVDKSESPQAATSAPQPPAAENKPEQVTAPKMPDRYIAYLFDDVHLRPEGLLRVRQAAQRHLDASLGPTDRAAIYTTSGQIMLDFTDDRAKLKETLLRLHVRPSSLELSHSCPEMTYYMADLILNKNDPQAAMIANQEAASCSGSQAWSHSMLGTDKSLASIQFAAVTEEVKSAAMQALTVGDYESHLALDVLRIVVRRVSALPRPRSIVLVSPGFYLDWDRQSDTTIILDRAVRSNVVVNVLDARGLYTTGLTASDDTPAGDTLSRSLKLGYHRQEASSQLQMLSAVAAGTGGAFFHNSNDLDEGFREVGAPPEYLYVLGFSPQDLKPDGRFHDLKVEVKNVRNVTIQARNGYYAPTRTTSAAEEAKREIEDALFAREELHDLPVELQTRISKLDAATAKGGATVKLSVFAHVDVKQIRFRKAEGRNRNDLIVVSGLFDKDGIFISAASKTVELRYRDESMAHNLDAGINVETSFDVTPGTYGVRLIVRDAEEQHMSEENATVEIQ